MVGRGAVLDAGLREAVKMDEAKEDGAKVDEPKVDEVSGPAARIASNPSNHAIQELALWRILWRQRGRSRADRC